MSKPQQPELHRSGRGAVDPASTKTSVEVDQDTSTDASNRIPPENRPGHHPDHEEDQPDLSRRPGGATGETGETDGTPGHA